MTAQQMPMWLVDQLDADGILDKTTRLTHKPKPRHCPQCGTDTLAALNDVGLVTHLDPAPVTSAGEAVAILTNRGTHGLDCGQIYTRDHWHIRGRPADVETVYAEHACGSPLPSKPMPSPRLTTDANQPPPF